MAFLKRVEYRLKDFEKVNKYFIKKRSEADQEDLPVEEDAEEEKQELTALKGPELVKDTALQFMNIVDRDSMVDEEEDPNDRSMNPFMTRISSTQAESVDQEP